MRDYTSKLLCKNRSKTKALEILYCVCREEFSSHECFSLFISRESFISSGKGGINCIVLLHLNARPWFTLIFI